MRNTTRAMLDRKSKALPPDFSGMPLCTNPAMPYSACHGLLTL